MTDKELEHLFQSKLAQRDVSYDPANWSAMEELLDARAGSSLRYFWQWTAGILALGLLLFAIQFTQASDSHSSNIAKEDTSVPSEPSAVSSSPKMEIRPAAAPINSSQNTAAEAVVKKPENSQAGTAEGSPTSSQAAEATAAATSTTPDVTNEGSTATAQVGGTDDPGLPGTALAKGEFSPASDAVIESTSASTPKILATTELSAKTPDFTISSHWFKLRKPYSLDSDHKPADVKPRFGGSHQLFAQGGMLLSSAFNDRSTGFGYEAGMYYSYRFSSKWSLAAGLGFAQQNNLGIVSSSDSVFYDFGKETIRSEYTTSSMSFIEAPLRIAYRPLPAHELSLSGYSSYLADVQEEYFRHHSQMKSRPVVEEGERSADSKGYRRWNFGLGAGYHYQINPQVSVGVDFRWGLTDLTYGPRPAFDLDHKNFSTRLQMRYLLWSH